MWACNGHWESRHRSVSLATSSLRQISQFLETPDVDAVFPSSKEGVTRLEMTFPYSIGMWWGGNRLGSKITAYFGLSHWIVRAKRFQGPIRSIWQRMRMLYWKPFSLDCFFLMMSRRRRDFWGCCQAHSNYDYTKHSHIVFIVSLIRLKKRSLTLSPEMSFGKPWIIKHISLKEINCK